MSAPTISKIEFSAVLSAPIGIFLTDEKGGALLLNPMAEKLLGLSTAEALGSGWTKGVHPDDVQRVHSTWLESCRRGDIFESEHRFVHGDGRVVWVNVKASQVRDADGKITGYAGTIEDITRRKRDEAILRESESQARQALRDLQFQRFCLDEHAIVSETDARGRITYVNDRYCEISGYTRRELIGKDHSIVNSGYHPRDFWARMYYTLAAGQTWHGEIKNRSKSGSYYWLSSTHVAVRGADGRIVRYIAISADVTAHKKMEADLQEAKIAADAANRAKSEFLANMSHEIRTPMTAILGYADMLVEENEWGLDAARRSDALETIRRNAHSLLTIINDILDLSKIEAGRMEVELVETSPLAMLQDVRALMQVRAAEKGLQLMLHPVFPIPRTIRTDPTRLRQILVNLVSNAIKFTQSGDVTLRCSFDPKEPRQMRFDVADSGVGMTSEQISRAFEPFVQGGDRTTRRYGGTGLGLIISRRFARMLGGDVTVRSRPGHGSCFTVCIDAGTIDPGDLCVEASACALPAPPPPPVNRSEKRLAGRRILMAEDGVDNQQLIGYCLRQAGAEVECVQNGKEAVLAASRPGAKFDLILMDMQMPVMDGYLATTLLRRNGVRIPIIALTAYAMVEDRQRCIDAGCDDYATKPINRRNLLEVVDRWMNPAAATQMTQPA